MAFDLYIQHLEDNIPNTGGTNTSFTVSSLAKAIEFASNNRYTHAGYSDLTATDLEGNDLSGARVLTAPGTLTYYREAGSKAATMRFNTSIMEYVGSSGGDNEFIVRGRYSVALNGATDNTTVDITSAGVVSASKCIAFITGVMNDVTVDGADSGTAVAYPTSTTSMSVWKGSKANNVTVYITLVEFTGVNWTVLNGKAQGVPGDSGTISLYDGPDATGSITAVSSWAETVLFGQHRGDTITSNVNCAIADNFPRFVPNALNSVDFLFETDHDAANGFHFVYALNNPFLNVTRYQNTNSSAGPCVLDITTAGLTSLDTAMVVGFTTSWGTGTAYGRGWRNYYLQDITNVVSWCHRSGNSISHEYQIVDFAALTSSGTIDVLLAVSIESTSEVTASVVNQEVPFLAVSIESASEVTAPVVGQEQGILAVSIEGASEVTVPAVADIGGGVNPLLAVHVESISEVTASVIGQEQVLLANDVQSISTLTVPSVTDIGGGVNPFFSVPIESASQVSVPVLRQDHTVLANDIQSTSTVAIPVVRQGQNLLANDVETTSEVSAPAATGVAPLLAQDVSSTSQTSVPVAGQGQVLLAVGVESASQITVPAIGQTHNLLVNSTESASLVSIPTLIELPPGTVLLFAQPVESASEVTAPQFTQVQGFYAYSVESSSQVFSPTIATGRRSSGWTSTRNTLRTRG